VLFSACLQVQPLFAQSSSEVAPEPAGIPNAELPEVAVSVARTPSFAASVTTVSSRELASVPRRSAEDALRLVPGFILVQHGSEGKAQQYFLRGFDAVHGADLEVTVDGIPINEWSNVHAQGYVDLGFVISELVLSVQATKGPFNVDQGAFALAGSANYRLGLPREHVGLRATYTLGSTNRQRAVVTFSPEGSDGSDFVGAEVMHDDGFGQNRAAGRASVLGRVRLYDSVSRGRVTFSSSAYVAEFGLPGALRSSDVRAGRNGFYDAYDHTLGGRSGRGLWALSYTRGEGGEKLQLDLFGGYRRLRLLENFTGFLLDPVAGDRRAQEQSTLNLGLGLTGDTALQKSLSLRAGAGIRADVFAQTRDHVDLDQRVLARERELRGVQSLSHVKAALAWHPSEDLSLVLGGRFDLATVDVEDRLAGTDPGTGTLAVASPRLSFELRMLTGAWLFGGYGRGFRPPEARVFSSFDPDRVGITEDVYTGDAATPSICDSFELGARFRGGRTVRGSVSGFATLVERESVLDHVSGVNLELNSTRRVGVEGQVEVRPSSGVLLSADATWVDARFTDSRELVPFAPWLSGGMRAVLGEAQGFRAGLRTLGIAPRPLPHGARGAALVLLDATLGYHWRRIELDLELENLLDLELREGEYHYASRFRPSEPASELPVLHYVAGPPFNARLSLTAFF
jgi:TonB-dependent receptor-like protein